MKFLKLNVVLIATVLIACAAQGPIYVPIDGSGEPTATIVIYRPSKWQGAGITPGLFVNDDEIFQLKNGGFGIVEIEPGLYTLSTPSDNNWTTADAPSHFDIEVEAGKAYFVRWQPQVRNSSVTVMSTGSFGHASFMGEFVLVDRAYAEVELNEVKRVYP